MQCTGNSGCFPRGKRAATVRRYPVFGLFSPCAVFSCFRNPPNSDMEYRIINMRTFLCVRIHTGEGAHRQLVSTIFELGKILINVYCAPDGIRTSGHGIHWISRLMLYQLSHRVYNSTTPATKLPVFFLNEADSKMSRTTACLFGQPAVTPFFPQVDREGVLFRHSVS